MSMRVVLMGLVLGIGMRDIGFLDRLLVRCVMGCRMMAAACDVGGQPADDDQRRIFRTNNSPRHIERSFRRYRLQPLGQ